MTYAIIGCGAISKNHIAAALNTGLEIVALCDIVDTGMPALLEQMPEETRKNVKTYADYKVMLNELHPDLVAIATGSGVKTMIALDCIAAGANVIIEKPIALSLQAADSIIAAAKEKGVQVCVCHQNRLNPAVQAIHQAAEEGRFGRMLHGSARILWNRNKAYYDAAKWRGTWKSDGGTLMNQCIHSIDILRWLMGGEVEQVFAYTDRQVHDYIEAEDIGVAVVKFKGGAYATIEGTVNVYPKNLEESLTLLGETGTVQAGGKSLNVIETWNFADKDDSAAVRETFGENPPAVPGLGHTRIYEDMIDAIRNHRAPCVSAEEGRKAIELILGIYQSAATGKPVDFPLTEGSTLDYVGRFES